MRKWLLLFVLCLSIGLGHAGKRALLVGISEYPQGSGWCKLSSDNDLHLLDSVLKRTMPISSLAGRNATKSGIIRALKDIASKAHKGDTILVHFSGHGQQMWAADGNENDLLDEAFVPYDAKKDSSATYSGQNHLRDNELGKYINAVRRKAGSAGLVIISIDACHSGSIDKDAQRGDAIVRGTFEIFGSIQPSEDDPRYNQPDDTSLIEKGNMADVIYLSACGQHEINREIIVEGKGYGSLSYSLVKAVSSSGLSDKVSFLDAVYAAMKQYQPLQMPKVRASFSYNNGWEVDDTLPGVQSVAEDEESQGYTCYIIVATIVLISLIVLFIWKRKKR